MHAQGGPDLDREADAIVVGAGPAGLMASIAAAERGLSVLLFEQLERPGAKLLATGGGRSNVTNLADPERMREAFGERAWFVRFALDALDGDALRRFLEGIGVPTAARDGFHVFPASESAADVCDALWRRARALGVRTILGVAAEELLIEQGALAGIATASGTARAPRVVVATGGVSYPDLGATGAGYRLAAQAGHSIARPVPALVGLVAAEPWVEACAGAVLTPARVSCPGAGRRVAATGPLLFTHRGISGPAALDISGDVAAVLARESKAAVTIDLVPGVDAEAWRERLDAWRRDHGRRLVSTFLDAHLPRSLAGAVAMLAGAAGAEATIARLDRGRRDRLAELLTRLPLTMVGTEGFEHAMVTRGGVTLREVDPARLESRRCAGLFFAGEVLDVDGPCGGYNLQWAFSSGRLAGVSAAQRFSRVTGIS